MSEQVQEKIHQGFRCLKLKIGALKFEEELELIKSIRKRYSAEEITLRVDANGAFSPDNANEKLKRLSELGIHSIEQPIKAGQWEKMSEIISNSPLPVALDEELIGYNTLVQKQDLLQTIKPGYIVLKPTLHGGISGCSEWIELAEKMGIGWWLTSALESNIGLNAIAHWCATLNNPLHQGLGTGLLYTNNIDIPLHIEDEHLWYSPSEKPCIRLT
jgi:L-alanine-DL-glutamate epimerase-like enolase superfamily enzyme